MNSKKLLIIICIIANQFINTAKAQAPQSFNYQAVARDASGAVLSNQAVSFRISLLQGSATGTSIYTETHAVTTNLLGLVNFAIGGGTVVSGNFATITWAQGPYFVQVELDAANNGNYLTMSTTQLLSVPYSLVSNALTLKSPNGTYWNLKVNDVGNLSTTNINCIPLSGLTIVNVPDSFSAGSSYTFPTLGVQAGTPPFAYNWLITPNDSNITIQNSTSSNPILIVSQNTILNSVYNLQATVSNCNGSNTLSQNFPITITAPVCPNDLPDSSNAFVTSTNPNVGSSGGVSGAVSSNQINIVYSIGGCMIKFNTTVNCLSHTLSIPSQNFITNGSCSASSGTISGSGTFNVNLTQMTITVTTVINSVSNTYTVTFTNN